MTKTAFKGFDENLRCRSFQFEVGNTYVTQHEGKPRLCSSQGFHYCNRLSNTFEFYKQDGKNRFCLVSVEGEYNEDNTKGITTKIKILRELSSIEIEHCLNLEKLEDIEENIGLEFYQALQEKFPLAHVGGSLGIFLHGGRLKRWTIFQGDLDIVIPYFMCMDIKDDTLNIESVSCKSSSNDFNFTLQINIGQEFRKVDVRIDPTQQYVIIEYKGFKYNVSKLATILDAKCRYSWRNAKHYDDIKELIGGIVEKPKQNLILDLPF